MVEGKLASLVESDDMDKDWDCFKTLIKEAVKDCCGSTKVGGSRKTRWTDEVKEELLKRKNYGEST